MLGGTEGGETVNWELFLIGDVVPRFLLNYFYALQYDLVQLTGLWADVTARQSSPHVRMCCTWTMHGDRQRRRLAVGMAPLRTLVAPSEELDP